MAEPLGLAGDFLRRVAKAGDLLPRLKREPYTPPTADQVRTSLTTLRGLLTQDPPNPDAAIAMRLEKFRERITYGSAEEKVALANDLYTLAAGINADLRREAPEIPGMILHEYRPLEPNETGIRTVKAPADLILKGIDKKLHALSQENPPSNK